MIITSKHVAVGLEITCLEPVTNLWNDIAEAGKLCAQSISFMRGIAVQSSPRSIVPPAPATEPLIM